MLTDSIVGIDLSLTSTGVSTWFGEYLITPKGLKGMPRLECIRDEVWHYIMESSENPVVVLEGYAMQTRNTSHIHALGEVGGVIRFMLHTNNIPYIDVPPTVRAKAITGRGNASKADVISHITKLTGKVWEGSGSDDKADAWVLREMALAHLGESQYSWNKAKMEAVEKVDWIPLDIAFGIVEKESTEDQF